MTFTDTTTEDELINALNSEDDLGAVIRAHIHIESALNNLIDSYFESPKHIDRMRLEFHEKVKLAQAIGLKNQYAKPLNTLGTIRNNFAHRLDTTLGSNEIDSLYKSFDGDDKQMIQGAYLRTNKSLKTKGPKSITKLKPKEQFTLIVTAMHQILIQAKKELETSVGA
ncbi:hypothetical protein [Sedimenticola hydrogenitrophicus]|uniref:hypothetical protein n=1 Tax=Sedimenticola hydrogenitrophicus TaxID=2967975 RepID=UPI0023B175AD|nr:hypothetical protein [Sedimenticola hydrogenitrophicus]